MTDETTGEYGSLQVFDLRRAAIEPRPVAGVRFIRLHQGLSADLADVMGVEVQEVHGRRAGGNQCFLALLDDDTIAGYGWVNVVAIRVYELEVEIPIPRGEAYIWDCATVPASRGRGIFCGLLCFVLEELRLDGYSRAWGGVAPGNAPSLRAFSRAGFRVAARVRLSLQHAEIEPLPAATAEEVLIIRSLRHQ